MAFPFRIKVCGITSEEAARAAIDAGADYLGLVLCPSVRRVTMELAAALVRDAPASWVGVFANPALDEVTRATRELGLAAVQLHGSETPERCQVVREKAGVPVWKAIPGDVAGAEVGYEAAVDALLLDSGKGGTGRILDWAAIVARFPRAERTIPVLLAGGLGPDNIAQAIDAARPDGVDASSRLEQRPGAKDPRLVHAYVLRARAAARAAADSDLAKAPW